MLASSGQPAQQANGSVEVPSSQDIYVSARVSQHDLGNGRQHNTMKVINRNTEMTMHVFNKHGVYFDIVHSSTLQQYCH